MENYCKYVSSRGILKSTDVHSNNPSSDFLGGIEYLNKFINEQDRVYETIKDVITIYVCSVNLQYFCERVLDRIRYKFVLVSGDSDRIVPYEVMSPGMYKKLISNFMLVKWYAQNLDKRVISENKEKVFNMPIGLDYHTIASNPGHKWRESSEGFTPVDQECILEYIKKIDSERECKIFCNVHFSLDRFGDRKKSLEDIPKELVYKVNGIKSRSETWKEMIKYSFVLSPYGNGMDCHRTWEALCLGCIPIVRGRSLEELYEDLPVLIVENWSDVTYELLNKTLEEFSIKEFKYEKLELNYWMKLFKNV
jgi:hypothetical protein